MPQFGVYRVKGQRLVIDCQHEFLSELESRVIAPLQPIGKPTVDFARLNPEVEVGGRRYRVAVQLLRAVDRRELGRSVAQLDGEDFAIKAALDLLISGF